MARFSNIINSFSRLTSSAIRGASQGAARCRAGFGKLDAGKRKAATIGAAFFLLLFCVTGFSGGDRVALRTSVLHGAAEEKVQEVLHSGIFSDVSASHQQAYALAYLKQAGFILGYSDGTFRPNEAVTRAEVAVFVAQSFRADPYRLRYSHCFADVTDDWYVPYVCFAKSKGWFAGLTTEKAAAPVLQEAQEQEAEESAEAHAEESVPEQILESFGPSQNASATEAATVVRNAYGLNDDRSFQFSSAAGDLNASTFTRGQMAQMLFEALIHKRPAL